MAYHKRQVSKLFCWQHTENILRAIDISRTYAYTYIHSQAAEARHRYSVAYHKRQVSLMASDVLVFSAQSTVCSARRMFSVCCQQNNLNFNGLRQTSKRFVTPYEIEIIVYTLPSPSSVSSLLLLARSFAPDRATKLRRLADLFRNAAATNVKAGRSAKRTA